MHPKDRIIVTCGTFDPLTHDELVYLKRCHHKGEWLVVGAGGGDCVCGGGEWGGVQGGGFGVGAADGGECVYAGAAVFDDGGGFGEHRGGIDGGFGSDAGGVAELAWMINQPEQFERGLVGRG